MLRRVLAIHAHPDDCEILAGGTLALLAARGHAITICSLTPGDCGSMELRPGEIAGIRRREAAAAAARIGGEYVCGGFRDLCIFQDDPSRRRVTAVLRRTRPDLILTASPVDYMCDHEAVSALVRDACFAAPVPNYDTSAWDSAPPLGAIPHLYFMDPIGGVDREGQPAPADFIVDVSAFFETKRQMLACHASQREWLRRRHSMDEYLETMERWTRLIGSRAGFEFGEGFRQYRGHPYPESNLLGELTASHP
jgi:LmbE family N-acetylglucosaminyl deacetylase